MADLYQRDFKCQGINENDINCKRRPLANTHNFLSIIILLIRSDFHSIRI